MCFAQMPNQPHRSGVYQVSVRVCSSPQMQRSTEQNIGILPFATGQSYLSQDLPKAGDSYKGVRQQLISGGLDEGMINES